MKPTKLHALLTKNTLLVAHDAGAATVISDNLNAKNPFNLHAVAEGPAVKILEPFVKTHSREELDKLLVETDLVLLATGWQSDLLGHALHAAKNHGVKTIGVVDRNINLELRFRFRDKLLAPDTIIAPSQIRLKIPTSLSLIPVLYFDDRGWQRRVGDLVDLSNRMEKTLDYLFIGQPLVDSHGVVDFESQFIAIREFIGGPIKSSATGFRPHPSQTNEVGKYLPDNVQICDPKEPAELQIARAKSVVGFNSVLLDLADAAHIPCIRIVHEAFDHAP